MTVIAHSDELADYREFFRLSADMLTVVAKGGLARRASESWRSILGYDPGEVVGRNVFNLIHPDDLGEAIALATQAEFGTRVDGVRVRMRKKSGGYKWVEWSISPAVSGEVMYCVARDIDQLVHKQRDEEMLVLALQASTRSLEETASQLDTTRAEAEYLASRDTLTGLLNRRAWLASILASPPRAIAIIDIDHFKAVNDAHGHPTGDDVIASIGGQIQGALGAQCTIGRIGGEEFGIAAPMPFEEAAGLVTGLVESIDRARVATRSGPLHVTVSCGVAAWNRRVPDAQLAFADAYERADSALYLAKQSGRNRLIVGSAAA